MANAIETNDDETRPKAHIDSITNGDLSTSPSPLVVPTQSAASPIANCSDLPVELLELVFWPIRPVLEVKKSISIDDIKDYNRELKHYADLRLSCRIWHQVITPILYEDVALGITPKTQLQNIADLFSENADHFRSIIVFGEGRITSTDFSSSIALPEGAAEVIGRGLGLCTRLHDLQLYANHPTFTSRWWLPKLAPTLSSTVTSLVISPHPRSPDLSRSLVGLGRTLEHLEILGWNRDYRSPPARFHLPAKFPKLTHLTLRDGYPSLQDIDNLLSRIANQKPCPLRSFLIFDIPDLTNHITTMLTYKNLGRYLTTFHFRRDWHGEPPNSTIPIAIMRLCPNLIDFSYLLFTKKDLFDCLSLSLRHLELLAWPMNPNFTLSLNDFAQFLRTRRCRALKTLSIVSCAGAFLTPTPAPGLDSETALRSVCRDLDAQITFKEAGSVLITL
ncbi:hypothetical protein Hypma_001703 [Hypsizygus marmoreus]|uniref:F-box domain-containing protein n=1 Tax=Hypsizygus marmoreus TaxID=39966 RepID=A0A369J784_HYPMA|nr:hypothetical protein Hypma_001703 [Hypsizygus marmoreus]